MLGVTNLTSLPEGVGEISVDGKMWNRQMYSERTMENIVVYYYLFIFCSKALSLALITQRGAIRFN
jgi:hypothetical protein